MAAAPLSRSLSVASTPSMAFPLFRSAISLRTIDIIVLALSPLLATILSISLHAPYGLSTILFYLLPALYLTVRSPKIAWRSLQFAALFGFSFTIVFNTIAIQSKSWLTTTIFSSLFMNIMPYEDLLWGFSIAYFGATYYKHFYGKGSFARFGYYMKHVATTLVGMTGAFLFIYLLNPQAVNIPYFYLAVGILTTAIPTIALVRSKPQYLKRVVYTAMYFALVNILFELTALSLHQWSFPGTAFVGWIEFGALRFPLEEFLFFIILGGPAITAFVVACTSSRARSGIAV